MSHPPLRDTAERWPVVDTEVLHDDAWVVRVRADTVRTPQGGTARRVAIEHPGAAVVLAADEHERVLCLWQYRHASATRFVEVPAGLLDGEPDESPLEVARRELREEAQLEAASWTPLTSVSPSPGVTSEVQHLFLARDLRHADRGDFELAHEEADMTLGWVPFADLHAAVLAGEVRDAPVVVAVLLAAARGLLRA